MENRPRADGDAEPSSGRAMGLGRVFRFRAARHQRTGPTVPHTIRRRESEILDDSPRTSASAGKRGDRGV